MKSANFSSIFKETLSKQNKSFACQIQAPGASLPNLCPQVGSIAEINLPGAGSREDKTSRIRRLKVGKAATTQGH